MSDLAWWQRGVIYQVYPRSFQDENGDGVGDLAGITARLEYLRMLGVDAVWMSPVYPSPMADFGDDIADYCAIAPVFGTLDDFDRLVAHAHELGLKVLLDFVPNHSSDKHPWFMESRSSRDNPKRDWYLWRDPAPDGGPPNNWLSRMGGSAWEKDTVTGQYYYHAFLREQPDLNWERVLIGEIYLPVPQLVSYYEPNGDGANMPFNFQLISAPWNATEIARIVSEYDHALPLHAWPNWVLSNHDNRRVASRIGPRQARVAAMLLLTLRGTPTLYYGDEIAMAAGVIPPDRVQDPAELRQPGIGQGRDPERTPMQWDGSRNAGFSSGVPWLPISGGDDVSVIDQHSKASSMLTFYRRLLALRRSELALVEGAIERVVSSESVLTYERRLGGDRFFIALNMAGADAPVDAPEGTLVLSTMGGHEGERIEGLSLLLAGDEGIVIRASEPA